MNLEKAKKLLLEKKRNGSGIGSVYGVGGGGIGSYSSYEYEGGNGGDSGGGMVGEEDDSIVLDFDSLHDDSVGYYSGGNGNEDIDGMVDSIVMGIESLNHHGNHVEDGYDHHDTSFSHYPDTAKGRDLDYDFDGNGNNYEGGMFLSNLYNMGEDIDILMSIVNEEDNLPQWVIEKIAICKDNINTVREYLEPKIKNYSHDDN
jgi:hypothetical protein